jgi:predicted enzyme related to lactoylglutathione lyase
MLSDARVHATIPAADLVRARTWYSDKLSLEPSEENGAGLFYATGENSRFFLFKSGGSSSGTHTQLGFTVKDIDQEVRDMKERGVAFEEYDFPQLKTVGGIATNPAGRSAWFKDSEGNMLGLFEPAG